MDKYFLQNTESTIQIDLQIRMSPMEIELLKCYYAKASCYIEFGCGGSTLEALKFGNIQSIYSIESDKSWMDKLCEYTTINEAVEQRRLNLIHADIGPTGDWGAPSGPSHVSYWPDYYWGVWSRLPKTPDCILIDGRFRVACAIMAALMCAPGHRQFIIHDFSERSEYHILHKYFQELESIEELSVFAPRNHYSTSDLLQTLHNYLFTPNDNVSQKQIIPNHIVYLQEEIIKLNEQIEMIKEELKKTEGSPSWRVTRPLRFAHLCLGDPREAWRRLKQKIVALKK